jgi:hypothetical protein
MFGVLDLISVPERVGILGPQALDWDSVAQISLCRLA